LIFRHFDIVLCALQKATDNGMEPLVVDVGMNVSSAISLVLYCRLFTPVLKVGYFSLLALSLGCRVIAFEPAVYILP
jgi:hypothetical protein